MSSRYILKRGNSCVAALLVIFCTLVIVTHSIAQSGGHGGIGIGTGIHQPIAQSLTTQTSRPADPPPTPPNPPGLSVPRRR